jgi:hypothetical protein
VGGAWLERYTQEHIYILEWFGPLERNTLRPLFCIALVGAHSTELEEARERVCVLTKEGLS